MTNEITVNETGRYRVIVNIALTTARDRMLPEMRITVNGTDLEHTVQRTTFVQTMDIKILFYI